MLFTIVCAVAFRGFIGRIAIFLALIFGTALSWLLDKSVGQINSVLGGATEATDHFRANFDARHATPRWSASPTRRWSPPTARRSWAGTLPSFSTAAILLVLPAVIALIAENTGHVKAVAEMTGHDLDPVMGRAIAADGVGTVLASAVGGSPTTTYAENIGVMAATRVYSTAAYYVAAIVAILFGLSPKFGALVAVGARRRPRRDHRGALRHDRPARRQDLEGERRRLRQPDQPRPARRRASSWASATSR